MNQNPVKTRKPIKKFIRDSADPVSQILTVLDYLDKRHCVHIACFEAHDYACQTLRPEQCVVCERCNNIKNVSEILFSSWAPPGNNKLKLTTYLLKQDNLLINCIEMGSAIYVQGYGLSLMNTFAERCSSMGWKQIKIPSAEIINDIEVNYILEEL